MKKLHWTDSEFDRTYFLFFFTNSAFFLPASTAKVVYQQIKKWFRRVDHQISGCEYIGRCLSVPLSQQNLVSTIASQPFEMQT